MTVTKISGFTVVKNAIELGYPCVESIESIAPLCDEVVINVGFDDPKMEDDDGTWLMLQAAFPGEKFLFIKSWWDPEITSHGQILSQQTNIALAKCQGKYCQYIQADEVVHEEDISSIGRSVEYMEKNPSLDGLVFRYVHFYGDPYIIKHTRNTYRREVRLIRNHRDIVSWRDAQGFRFRNGGKIRAVLTPARIFHYGWARRETLMDKKNKAFGKLYHGRNHREKDFAYQHIWGLLPFSGTHPAPIKNWVERNRSDRDILSLPLKFEWKNIGLALSDWIEKYSGHRLGEYKNYTLFARGFK